MVYEYQDIFDFWFKEALKWKNDEPYANIEIIDYTNNKNAEDPFKLSLFDMDSDEDKNCILIGIRNDKYKHTEIFEFNHIIYKIVVEWNELNKNSEIIEFIRNPYCPDPYKAFNDYIIKFSNEFDNFKVPFSIFFNKEDEKPILKDVLDFNKSDNIRLLIQNWILIFFDDDSLTDEEYIDKIKSFNLEEWMRDFKLS